MPVSKSSKRKPTKSKSKATKRKSNAPGHEQKFNQLLDDAIFGVKRK